jgi:hypothetical protein
VHRPTDTPVVRTDVHHRKEPLDSADARTGTPDRAQPVPAAGRRDRRWIWLAGAITVACYAPVLFLEYGFSEDYRLLEGARLQGGLSRLLLAEGRPVYAVWARTLFGALGSIDALVLLRALNIGLLATVAVLLAATWRRSGVRAPWAALAGAATMTLPPFQLYAGTAAMGGVPFAMLAAGSAAFLAEAGVEGAGPRRAGRWLAATFVLTLAFATYQPAGLFFWVVSAIAVLASPRLPFRRAALWYGTVGAAAMAVSFGLFLIGRSMFPAELIEIGAPRGTLAFDPIEKLRWFLLLPLPRALSFWKLWPSLTLAFVLVLVLAGGLAIHLRRQPSALPRAAYALLLVPLVYLPNLIVSENHSSFRSMPALSALMFSLLILVASSQLSGGRRWLFRALLVAAALGGSVAAATTTVRYIAWPQARELALVEHTIAGLPDGTSALRIVPSDWQDSLAPMVLGDEFGYPSTALPWSRLAMTRLVIAESRPDLVGIPVADADSTAAAPAPGETVIDWGDVLRDAR